MLDAYARNIQTCVPMSSSDSSLKNTQTTARSPFAGCFILIAAIMVMVFLIGFSTWVLFRQFAEIERFTETTPRPREVAQIATSHQTEAVALIEKIEAFRQKIHDHAHASVRLSADDLNLAIAIYEPLHELRGTFEVLSISEDAINIAISFPINGKPRRTRNDEPGWITSDSRYLNAIMRARPALLQGEVILEILEIHPYREAGVPREFIELMSPYRIAEPYLAHPHLGPAMAALTRVTIEDSSVVLAHEPGVDPEDFITQAQVDSGARRIFMFFGFGATIFLIFAATAIIIGLQKSKKDLP